MAFTRFNYDKARTQKKLQESMEPCDWYLNVPGNGIPQPTIGSILMGHTQPQHKPMKPVFFDDPHIRQQKWGGNLAHDPILVSNDLERRHRKGNPYCRQSNHPYQSPTYSSSSQQQPTQIYKPSITNQSRTTNPSWMYRDLEQTRWEYPLLNPQEHVCYPFEHQLNTRLLERDNFIPEYPCVGSDGFNISK